MKRLPDDRHHLVTDGDNLKIAYSIAWLDARKRSGLPADEIRRAALFGLVIAAMHYDASRGVKFMSYAGDAIRQQVGAALRDRAGLRIPADARGHSRLGREERAARAAARREADLPAARLAWATASLDEVDESGRPRGENLADHREPAGLDLDERDVLGVRLARLTARERDVIVRRFGLDGGEPEEQREIAARWGRTKQRIQQIEAGALAKLRRMYEADDRRHERRVG